MGLEGHERIIWAHPTSSLHASEGSRNVAFGWCILILTRIMLKSRGSVIVGWRMSTIMRTKHEESR
eukprot:1161668-Pelagomonas_calceolata.AAC.7